VQRRHRLGQRCHGIHDVVMASILHLANTLKLLDGHPRLVEYVKRHSQRPAVRKAVSG
jgi:glutathione S-transferase